MPNNFLITGPPGSGKSTIVHKVVEALSGENLNAGGIYCPEIRKGGVRRGFRIESVSGDRSEILAHEQLDRGPKVSKYRVNVPNIDSMSREAISEAIEDFEFVVIDEIAPMEVHSEVFKEHTKRALDSEKPLLGVIHERSQSGFIGEVKRRSDIRIFEVNEETREYLPEKIRKLIRESLS